MKAYRLGNVAFVMLDNVLVVKAEFENFEAARKAVVDFNAGRHVEIGRGW